MAEEGDKGQGGAGKLTQDSAKGPSATSEAARQEATGDDRVRLSDLPSDATGPTASEATPQQATGDAASPVQAAPAEDKTRLSETPAAPTGPAASAATPPQQAPDDATSPTHAAPDDDKTRLSDAPDPARTVLSDRPADIQPPAIVEPGRLINNNYRILELVSTGGMGEVYRGENIFTGDPVAIKVVLPALARDRNVIDMFMREARVLVQLRDSAIVQYHNFVLDQGLGRYCLIMEFVSGRHLLDRLKADGALSPTQALQLLRRIGGGLVRAHARGVVHRDLSPDNVILRDDNPAEAVLIDFGIARLFHNEDGQDHRFAGKFRYVAPEQLGHGNAQIGPQADIYSLALLIAATLRGEPLPMGGTAIEASAARQSIPDLSGIPHDLFPLLQYMLEPDPARRPADLTTVLRALDDPSLIPARYRLPLWPSEGGDSGATAAEMTTGALSLPQTEATDSSSPFPVGWSAPVQPPMPETAAPSRARLWLWAVPVVLAALAAGYFATRPEPAPPEPVAEPETVAPMALPPRDPATRDGFLAGYPLPDCTLATRVASGPEAGTIRVLSAHGYDPQPLATAYQQQFGAAPAFVPRAVAPGHCPAIRFLAELSGRGSQPPGLDLVSAEGEDGLQIAGRITGTADRPLWLALATPDGELHDLTRQLGPSASFGFVLTGDITADAPYLLIAMTTAEPLATLATLPAITTADSTLPALLDDLTHRGEAPRLGYALIAAGDSDEE